MNPSRIKNKCKREEVYSKVKHEKKKAKNKLKRARETEDLGTEVKQKKIPKTLDNTREFDKTTVSPDDEEVFADEAEDEFAPYFQNEKTPKIMITTRPRPSGKLFAFIGNLLEMLPNAFFYPRKTFHMKQICQWAVNKNFTHLFVLSEKQKVCNGIIISHLPAGPTAYFKVSNVIPTSEISNHGRVTAHQPELILNNFNTRLGHRVGRFLGGCYPHDPEFKGRQVVTFHNQRDFIFVRHHRYVFEPGKDGKIKSRLQELGPRFTLKMRWLQEGSFDSKFGEYEWIHKRGEMDTSRRKFHL